MNKNKLFLIFKRILDIVGSLIGLTLSIPIFIFLIIAMKITEPKAPFIFSQIRVGKNNKKFTIYKIRSMSIDAEAKLEELLQYNEIEGAMFKMKDDPRVTRIGKFIRKTSIDELPQLINVLKGDMSLVGPRPPLPREVKSYTEYDMQRLSVKPGCTGLWQVSGRSEMTFKEMVELDLEYIQKQSLWTDIIIILKTVKVMLFRSGAY